MANIVSRIVDKAVHKGANAAKKARTAISNEVHFNPEELKKSGFNVFKFDEDGIPVGFNGKAKTAITLAAIGSALSSGVDQRNINDMGTYDGRIKQPTPDYSEYVHMNPPSSSYQSAPAGADGSLVFALNNCRNGGFL